jgi:selenocysteine lyase/cysteine desulfurase
MRRTGCSCRKISLYKNLEAVSKDEIVSSLVNAVREETRIIGLTWVHSNTGLKIPISEITDALREINKQRDGSTQIKVIVDGVHGFGIEMDTFKQLGCDFFITSGHKWIYGPRGTGFIAGTSTAWEGLSPVIPSYTEAMEEITEGERPEVMNGKQMTPGGFHSLEYRWALKEGFEFMLSIGKENVYKRVHDLNRQCKEGLARIPHVKLHTPLSDDLSAGIISFDIDGMKPDEVVEQLMKKKIIATVSPYKVRHARFTPGIINTPLDVDKAVKAVAELKR